MPRRKAMMSDLQKEASEVFYLVELTWNDGVRTDFVIRSLTQHYAIQAVEVKALQEFDGYIISSRAYPMPIPEAHNLPVQVMTDHTHYKEPQEVKL